MKEWIVVKKKTSPARKSAKSVIPPEKVKIRQLPTGVRGLDGILGGGLPVQILLYYLDDQLRFHRSS